MEWCPGDIRSESSMHTMLPFVRRKGKLRKNINMAAYFYKEKPRKDKPENSRLAYYTRWNGWIGYGRERHFR